MTATLADPIAAADRKSMSDSTAAGSCPLTLADLHLIPVRYAYAEEDPGLGQLDPGFETDFRPMGIRTVRDGYLYLFHSSAPDILQEFVVTEGGAVEKRLWEGDDATKDQRESIPAEAAIIVPRKGQIEVLFSETQLTAKKCSMLIGWQDYRQQVMRTVNLDGYCPESGHDHLVPKETLETALVHPESGEAEGALAPWYWAAESAEAKQEPFAHRLTRYEKDHAYLVVDDLTGQISDLLDAWREVDTTLNDWLAEEDVRYYPAKFIHGLMKLDDETVASFVDAVLAQVDDPDEIEALERIGHASAAQRQEVADLAKEYVSYGPGTQFGASETVKAWQVQSKKVKELATQLATSTETLDRVLEALHDNQKKAEHGSLTGERGIRHLVRVDEMNRYLEKAEATLETLRAEKEKIARSLQTLIPSYHLVGHVYDRLEEQAYLDFLRLDNAQLNVLNEYAEDAGDFSFLTDYYFGNEIGHQHLVSFDIEPEAYARSIAKLLDALKKLLDARDNAVAYDDWQNTLAENPQLRFATLTPALSAELSQRLAQKQPAAKQALFSLVEKTSDARLHDRLMNVFKSMNAGLRAHLLDNQLLYKLDLGIADEGTLGKADDLITDLETHARQYNEYKQREARLDQQRRESNRALRKDQKNIYDAEIRRLRAARRAQGRKVKQARKALEDLAPSEGNQYNGILKIGNLKGTAEARAVMAELDELEKLRNRSGMKAVFDHARGLVNGDNAGDITRRIGGLGVVSLMGLVSFVGLAESFKKWWREDEDGSVLDVISTGSGALGATASVVTIVGSARLNYYYQHVSKAESVLTRLARANVWGGTIAAWGGFLAAGAEGLKHLLKVISGSGNAGSNIGSVTVISGSFMIAHGSRRLGVTGTQGIFHILKKRTEGVTWRSVHKNMLHLGGGMLRGMNAWLWAGTILVLVGEYIHNRFTRSELQAWCEKSQWGNESESWNADEQRYELAKLTYRPELFVMAEREALSQQFRYCSIELVLPGISKLSADNAEWVILEKRGTEWHAATGEWSEAFLPLGSSEDVVRLRASLLFDELEWVNGLYLAVRFKPDGVSDWLPGSGKAFHARLAFHEQGNVPHVPANSEKAWQPLKVAEEPEQNIAPLILGYESVLAEESDA
jgi:flagellar hook-basal body complex protein FliE